MSVARRLVPGRTHAVVRRTAQRCFFLVPSKWVRQLVLYVLGLALTRFAHVKLHALMAESNHIHFVVTDDTPAHEPSQLPDFFGLLHSLIARALNARYGRGENLFKTGSYDNVEIHGDMSLERQLVYLWTNPVKDGLVARPELWPGAKTLPVDFGTTIDVDKPDGAFFGGRRPAHIEKQVAARRQAAAARAAKAPGSALAGAFLELEREEREALVHDRDLRREKKRAEAETKREAARPAGARPRRARKRKERAPRPPRDRSALPDRVQVRIDPPPGYSHLGLEGTRARFERLTTEAVTLIHRERELLGQTQFLGIQAVLLQDPRESAGDTFPTFARNPRIACSGVGPRLEVLRGLQAWRRDVGEKRLAWVGGDREVVFPAGVYGLWRFHGARVVGARPRAPVGSTAVGVVATPVCADGETASRAPPAA